jgi:hypothetical protein
MKEKDYIEELIRENLDGLNDFEPAEGHFDRFEAKLKAQSKRKKLNFGIVWKVAAIVIFVVLAANQAYIYFAPANKNGLNENGRNTGFTLSSVSQEYGEVEFYYNTAINTGLSQWNNMKEDGLISETEQEAMNAELAEFEARFKTLQADLAANPNDERVINAMLEYYKAKLDIINMIVNKLEEVKQQKITSHENNI